MSPPVYSPQTHLLWYGMTSQVKILLSKAKLVFPLNKKMNSIYWVNSRQLDNLYLKTLNPKHYPGVHTITPCASDFKTFLISKHPREGMIRKHLLEHQEKWERVKTFYSRSGNIRKTDKTLYSRWLGNRPCCSSSVRFTQPCQTSGQAVWIRNP